MSAVDPKIFLPVSRPVEKERIEQSFRLVLRRRAPLDTLVREFESALAAFYFTERIPDLESAEFWHCGERLCRLHRIELASGSIWQIGAAHKPSRKLGQMALPRQTELQAEPALADIDERGR